MTRTDHDADTPQPAEHIDKPWGEYVLFAVTPAYAGGVLLMKRGHSASLQFHRERDETLYLHTGRMMIETEDSLGTMHEFEMSPGHSIRFRPGRRHRISALEDSVIFEVSTPHVDDIVRLEDRYGRK